MDALWGSPEPLTAAQLQGILSRSRKATRAQTTILTVLSRLEGKGFVVRDRSQRPHRYSASQERAQFTAELMHDVLGGAVDREAVLTRFLGEATPADTEVIRRLLAS